jgi:hypothetical protein
MREITCPDCRRERVFAGFAADIEEQRESVRIMICKSCHVMEKVVVGDGGMRVLQRCQEITPRRLSPPQGEPQPA